MLNKIYRLQSTIGVYKALFRFFVLFEFVFVLLRLCFLLFFADFPFVLIEDCKHSCNKHHKVFGVGYCDFFINALPPIVIAETIADTAIDNTICHVC